VDRALCGLPNRPDQIADPVLTSAADGRLIQFALKYFF
jgi:hypothetical protein